MELGVPVLPPPVYPLRPAGTPHAPSVATDSNVQVNAAERATLAVGLEAKFILKVFVMINPIVPC